MSQDTELFKDETPAECWRDQSRICSESCVAFDARALSDERFNCCLVLNNSRMQTKILDQIYRAISRPAVPLPTPPQIT